MYQRNLEFMNISYTLIYINLFKDTKYLQYFQSSDYQTKILSN